ncbi:MAG: M13 family metallopeptidase [Alphaproteobacteria bacterium]
MHAFKPHIGYPDKWRDYSGLAIKRGDLIGDVERSDAFEWNYQLNRIDQPVDRDEWGMTPPTVNACITPLANAIFFPAAILQPPFDFFSATMLSTMAASAVIGHEISHGFDDEGSQYDAKGNLKSWWTPEDRKIFDERTAAFAAQYDEYEPLPGLHVNGKLTLGENIADLAGLAITYKAYEISLGGKKAPVLDGYSGEQRVFYGFAKSGANKVRDAALRSQVEPAFTLAVSRHRSDVQQRRLVQGVQCEGGRKYFRARKARASLVAATCRKVCHWLDTCSPPLLDEGAQRPRRWRAEVNGPPHPPPGIRFSAYSNR